MQPASPGPLVQIHISLATTITSINLGGAGKGLRAGHWEVAVPEVSALPRPGSNGHSAAAARRVDTHSLLAALAAETGRGKRPTQSSPGGWAAAPSRPFSSSPPQQWSGCHFETSGAVPPGRVRQDSQQMDP